MKGCEGEKGKKQKLMRGKGGRRVKEGDGCEREKRRRKGREIN